MSMRTAREFHKKAPSALTILTVLKARCCQAPKRPLLGTVPG